MEEIQAHLGKALFSYSVVAIREQLQEMVKKFHFQTDTWNTDTNIFQRMLFRLINFLMLMAALEEFRSVGPLETIKERTRNLIPLPGFITVTSSRTKPDMITFDDSPDEKRAIMPCGHVIGPETMTSYCKSVLSEGKFKFYCPSVDEKTGKGNCNREWDYFLVCHVACLSPDEMEEFEKKISDNYLQNSKSSQTCPGCKTWCYKEEDNRNNVMCPLCNKHFCWACLRDWIGPNNCQSCGNFNCNGVRDNISQSLAKCRTKQIGTCQECPALRICPKCGVLIELGGKCPHIICSSCSHGFCFICLKGKTSSGGWPCSHAGICTLAPRQTSTSWCAPDSQPASQTRTTSSVPASQPESQTRTTSSVPANQPESSSRCSVM